MKTSLQIHIKTVAVNNQLKTLKRFHSIKSVFKDQKTFQSISEKIKNSNQNVSHLEIFKNLLEHYPHCNTPQDITNKFRILNDISPPSDSFDYSNLKIPQTEGDSVLMENIQLKKEKHRCTRTILHFHSIGLIAGSPCDIVNPLGSFFEKMFCSKILVPSIPSLESNKFQDLVEIGLKSYRYLVDDLKIDSRSIVFSGSSSGCLLMLHVMKRLQQEKGVNYEELPELHFFMGPKLAQRPKRSILSASIAISPIYDIYLHQGRDAFFTNDIVDVVNKTINKSIGKKDAEDLNTFETKDTKDLSYVLNLTDDHDVGYPSVIRLREAFSVKTNQHWFSYKNFSERFHLYPIAMMLQENRSAQMLSKFFLQSNSNV